MTLKTRVALKLLFCALSLGVCSSLFANSAAAQSITWETRPNCKDAPFAYGHVCEINLTPTTIGNDNTPYNQWTLSVWVPGIVTAVTCQLTGSNQFEYWAAFGGPKRNPFPGEFYGNVGFCRGWINGGEAPVIMTVYYRR
jgi:hypothetical protein